MQFVDTTLLKRNSANIYKGLLMIYVYFTQ